MRPTFATVHLDAIVNNYRLAGRLTPISKNIPVIKADAYGHGMVKVAKALEPEAPALGVAFMDEAVLLREAGIRKPILVLQGVSNASDIAEAAANDYWLRLHQQRQVDWVLSANIARPVGVWVNVDTGMRRFGFVPKVVDQVCGELLASSNVRPDLVLSTHLACADDPASSITTQQVNEIRTCTGKHNLALSIANSAGVLCWPESHAEWNRPGYMLYGNSPMASTDDDIHTLSPAMTMRSEIVAVRDIMPGEGVGYGHDWVANKQSRIGTIAIGYGDGYPRHAPNGTPVLVNGQRVPLVGRVSMDAIMVDISDLDKVGVGDPVELWGQDLSINEVALAAGTIGYEIMAGLTGRVPLIHQP